MLGVFRSCGLPDFAKAYPGYGLIAGFSMTTSYLLVWGRTLSPDAIRDRDFRIVLGFIRSCGLPDCAKAYPSYGLIACGGMATFYLREWGQTRSPDAIRDRDSRFVLGVIRSCALPDCARAYPGYGLIAGDGMATSYLRARPVARMQSGTAIPGLCWGLSGAAVSRIALRLIRATD